ncbi:efflux transporter periplasmic adaptor subunit [Ectothiorhodospiraceae bacterium WFHF3C12]|nr:efflux transporter periplasmic adaptor subunit [Ectothiorhodospiraceae bacterium WFHF3C12]
MKTPGGIRHWSWVLGLFVLGLALAGWLIASREPPGRSAAIDEGLAVSVVRVQALPVVPRAVGYGSAQPGRTWQAVAEVPGRVTYRHPKLEPGALMGEGTVLLRLDATDYELAVAQLEATVDARAAALEELDVRTANTRTALDIEQRRLALAEGELERSRSLARQGSVSASEVDAQQERVLQIRQSVQQLKTTLAARPAERRRLVAELERDRAQLRQARRDVDRTVIRAPYDLRIAAAPAEADQYAGKGETLLRGDGVAVAEVIAQVPVSAFRNVLKGVVAGSLLPGSTPDLDPLSARITLVSGGDAVHWDARVARVTGSIDPQTRTVGVVAAVDRPYANADPPARPPLAKNMYVRVEVRGIPQPDALVVPRASVQGGRVYVANDQDRLEIRDVEIAYRQQDFVVVADGLKAGERVLLGHPVPAVEGARLAPAADKATERRVAKQATAGEQLP